MVRARGVYEMIFQKEHWEMKFAIPLWEENKAKVGQAIGGSSRFDDAAHYSICKSSFCEAVWWCWTRCNAAKDQAPARLDASSAYEDYENVPETLAVLETFCLSTRKRASMRIAREKAFILGWLSMRPHMVILWDPPPVVDYEILTDHDRRTWARQ